MAGSEGHCPPRVIIIASLLVNFKFTVNMLPRNQENFCPCGPFLSTLYRTGVVILSIILKIIYSSVTLIELTFAGIQFVVPYEL